MQTTVKTKRKSVFRSDYLVLIIAFLVLVTTTHGIVLAYQSSTAIKAQINARMLDVSNTAADMIDGDVLERLTPDDKGTPEYETVMKLLSYFQDNIELEYIYCIKDMGNKNFVFTLDPTVNDPGEYGSPVTYTDALYMASRGKSAVDESSYADAWGEFYSSYSPVFDSTGKVAGIVAVDFSKEWYDDQIIRLIESTVIISLIALVLAVVVVVMLTRKNVKRIGVINSQLNELVENFDKLMHEVRNMSGVNVSDNVGHKEALIYDDSDDIDSMRLKILALQDELYAQIESVKEQAYIDGMTGVRNKLSYLNTEKHINRLIAEGSAAFSVIVFDMNGLKAINDNLGHEYGDMAIIDATKALSSVYDKGEIFRIGGDEFIVIVNTVSETEVQNRMSRLEYRIAAENVNEKPYKTPLSLSMGYAIYDPEKDKEYKEVFHRADQRMYEDKTAYYMKHGDRRRKKARTAETAEPAEKVREDMTGD